MPNSPYTINTLTPPVVTTQPLQMLRLDLNSLNTEDGRPFVKDTDLTDGYLLSDKMKVNLHTLDALMLNGVGGEVHDADVVTADKSTPRRRSLELM
jgi:hypothetical protein